LRRKNTIDWENMKPNEFGMKLKKIDTIKNKELKKFYNKNK
jgi:hypothetical protein